MLYFGLILVRLRSNPCLSKQRIYLFILLDLHSPALPRVHSDWHVERPLEPPRPAPSPPKATPTGHEHFLEGGWGGWEADPLILLCNYCSPLRLNQFSENQIRWPKSFSFLLTSSNISLSNRGRAKHHTDTAALIPPSPPHRTGCLFITTPLRSTNKLAGESWGMLGGQSWGSGARPSSLSCAWR